VRQTLRLCSPFNYQLRQSAALNKDNGIVRATESNNKGYYVVPLLQPGNYTITAKANGFQTIARGGIKLEATQNARIDFALQVGATQHSVEVVVNVSPLNQENAELKTGISHETLQQLPLNSFRRAAQSHPHPTPSGARMSQRLAGVRHAEYRLAAKYPR